MVFACSTLVCVGFKKHSWKSASTTGLTSLLLQFVYQTEVAVEDAVLYLLHQAHTHLVNRFTGSCSWTSRVPLTSSFPLYSSTSWTACRWSGVMDHQPYRSTTTTTTSDIVTSSTEAAQKHPRARCCPPSLSNCIHQTALSSDSTPQL